MTIPGPELESLIHRLAACPEEFYGFPIHSGQGNVKHPQSIDLNAIVADYLRDRGVAKAERRRILNVVGGADQRHQFLISITLWLLRDPWIVAQEAEAGRLRELLCHRLGELAQVVKPPLVVTDSDRREELVRVCLAELGFRPAGETPEQAKDRLSTLDSIERTRVVKQTRKAEARARRIREEMARRRAEEAAARYSPE